MPKPNYQFEKRKREMEKKAKKEERRVRKTNKDSTPVSTYYVVSFNLPADPAQAKQITDACKLPGYSS